MLVLKSLFGGSLKIASENKLIFEAKNSLKRRLGYGRVFWVLNYSLWTFRIFFTLFTLGGGQGGVRGAGKGGTIFLLKVAGGGSPGRLLLGGGGLP